MSRPIARIAPLIAAALLTVARPAPAADDLPEGEAVIDQYIEATGGKAAYEKLKNRVAISTVEEVVDVDSKNHLLPKDERNLHDLLNKNESVLAQAEPNKKKFMIFNAAFGSIFVEGSDGQFIWESIPAGRDRIIEGEEKVDKADDALFNGEIKYKQRYSKIEVVGVEDVEGKPAYKLILTPKAGGKTSTEFYDKASHLLVKSIKKKVYDGGESTVETFPGDYNKVDGVLMPHSFRIKTKDTLDGLDARFSEARRTISAIKHNVDLPAEIFKLPESLKKQADFNAIKALAEKKDK